MGESRADLLNWVNTLLEMNLTKVEQCGTGAVFCQIVDSIYGDLMLNKVKFDTKQEYEYVNNFKVLQDAFTRHGIDKPIPVDRLVKCKMQDNLEFLQWIKKFWESNGGGQAEYNAVARRKGAGGPSAPAAAAAAAPTVKKPAPAAAAAVTPKPAAAAASAAAKPAPRPAAAVSATAPRTTSTPTAIRATSTSTAAAKPAAAKATTTQDPSAAQRISELEKQATELKLNVENLEKERDFYFGKLRDIEILIQNLESNPEPEHLKSFLPSIQQILYSTEDGFETPAVVEEESF